MKTPAYASLVMVSLLSLLLVSAAAPAATIHLVTHSFDPLDGEPELAGRLLADEPAEGEYAYYLVQLSGPPTEYRKDAVSSAGGAPLQVDDWGVDLCLVGTQKAMSVPPDGAMVAVSERAWDRIERVGYAGYDALGPWKEVGPPGSFPYTPSWHVTAAIHAACGLLLEEGLDAVLERHAAAAARCRERTADLGLELFPVDPASSSPTVTALAVPDTHEWPALDAALRERGVVLGGSWGALQGRVFRVGHMGDQARTGLVDQAMDALAEILGR